MLPPLIPLLALVLGPADAPEEPVRFGTDVMAVLSRGGCNAGACHGNLNGKGGLKLSLRGEDPRFDFDTLTRGTLGRRIDPHRPEESLLLLKATGAVPHEGGKRFGTDSPEYRALVGWIAAGAPRDPADVPSLLTLEVTPTDRVVAEPHDRLPLRVVARFTDGRRRDVTRFACFEPSNPLTSVTPDGVACREGFGETALLVRYLDRQATVRIAWVPDRPGFTWSGPPEANAIDRLVFARLRELRMNPSAPAPDSVFLRRAYLDLLGVLPAADEARAFLDDIRSDKRARLIDRLLQRPEFADFWALKWSDLLRNEEKALDRKGVQALHRWLRQGFLDGRPLDELARAVITGRGSTYERPEANFYRALRDTPSRAEAVAQVFLGVRLQCARCHNHPFDVWTQDDYYGLSAFFPRIQYRIIENRRRDRLDSHEFDGEQVVYLAREGEVKHPRTGAAVPPRFPAASGPAVDPEGDRLAALADWITRPDNPYFARTQANRTWYHLLGRGLVDPIDDFRSSNPAVSEPLLDFLTRELVAHRFDLRHLVRLIATSQTYQLSGTPNDTNRDDESHFARAVVRPLQAEQLLDAVAQVTGASVRFNGYPVGVRAGQLPGVRAFRVQDQRLSDGERFLQVFGKPERSLTCECERSEETTLSQAFQMISGELVHRLLTAPDNRLGRLIEAGRSDAAILDELYLAALARRPTAKERTELLAFLGRASDRRAALEDVLWGLLNAREFLLRH